MKWLRKIFKRRKKWPGLRQAIIDASKEEISKVVDPLIAEAIVRVREEKAKVIPGYDGVYGELAIFEENQEVGHHQKPKQKSMSDFI